MSAPGCNFENFKFSKQVQVVFNSSCIKRVPQDRELLGIHRSHTQEIERKKRRFFRLVSIAR